MNQKATYFLYGVLMGMVTLGIGALIFQPKCSKCEEKFTHCEDGIGILIPIPRTCFDSTVLGFDPDGPECGKE